MSVIIFTIHNVSIYTIHMDPMGIHIALSFINPKKVTTEACSIIATTAMEFKRCRDLADAWLGLGTVSRCQGVGKNMGGFSAFKMLGNIWKYMEIYGI